MFELTIGHVIILLFDVLPWLHQFCHFITVEDLLFIFGPGGLLPLVLDLTLSILFLHFAGPFPCAFDDFFTELLLLAEVLKDIGAVLNGVEILKEGVVLGELWLLYITRIHLLFNS